MKHKSETPPDRAGRTLIKAFVFAGTILGVGAYGLARTVVLLGRELEWIAGRPGLGAWYWWLGAGAGVGGLVGWLLVRTRRRGE